MKIEINLNQLYIKNNLLPPDIEINVPNILSYTFNMLDENSWGHGLQYDGNNYLDIQQQCDNISKEIIKLYKLINKGRCEH